MTEFVFEWLKRLCVNVYTDKDRRGYWTRQQNARNLKPEEKVRTYAEFVEQEKPPWN